MVETAQPSGVGRTETLDERLSRLSLAGYWPDRSRLSPLQPYVWRWADVDACWQEAGTHVAMGQDASRRTSESPHPTLAADKKTRRPLQMSIQLVHPGEVAECHRHTSSAARFVVMGRGAYTTVEGERLYMSPGDLVLTPGWSWH